MHREEGGGEDGEREEDGDEEGPAFGLGEGGLGHRTRVTKTKASQRRALRAVLDKRTTSWSVGRFACLFLHGVFVEEDGDEGGGGDGDESADYACQCSAQQQGDEDR